MNDSNPDLPAAGFPDDVAEQIHAASQAHPEIAAMHRKLSELASELPAGASLTYEHDGLVIRAGRDCVSTSRTINVTNKIDLNGGNADALMEAFSRTETERFSRRRDPTLYSTTEFACSIGQEPIAGPAGRLIQAITVDCWRDLPKSERPRILALNIAGRKNILVITQEPLTGPQYEAIRSACRAFERELYDLARAKPEVVEREKFREWLLFEIVPRIANLDEYKGRSVLGARLYLSETPPPKPEVAG